MGVKMENALLNGKTIEVNDATKDMRGHLKCSTDFCNAKVTWVEIHKENKNIKTRYFRLLPKRKHHFNCKYNTLGQILAVIKASDQDLIKSIDDKKFEFRLNIIFESIDYLNKLQFNISSKVYSNEMKKNKKFITEGKLSSYLSSMSRLMELRSNIEKDTELKDIIRLKVGDSTVSWDDLYYKTKDFLKCYNYIRGGGINTKSWHPICVQGYVHDITDLTEKYGIYAISLKSQTKKLKNEFKLPRISLHTKETNIITLLENYRNYNGNYPEIAAYCIMHVKEPHKNGSISYWDVKGKVYRQSQLIIL
ncbi:hypothetical protein N6H14_14635 [Paenibacillus sp. CC-CFT747]|nr:hypothetical protein N6H14_14635 [Paenibacillus sp. CC-CFT747]